MQYRCCYGVSFKQAMVSDYRIRGGAEWNGRGPFCGKPWTEICLELLNRQGFQTSTAPNKSGATMFYISCQNNVKCWCLTNRPWSAFVVLRCPHGVVEIWTRKFQRQAAAVYRRRLSQAQLRGSSIPSRITSRVVTPCQWVSSTDVSKVLVPSSLELLGPGNNCTTRE